MSMPSCPQCKMNNTYSDTEFYICPDCGNEWTANDELSSENELIAKDINNNLLHDGDSVCATKDLKVRGSSMVIKQGTLIKKIRIVDGDHNLDCKVNGTNLQLKSEFMRKV